MNRYFAAITFLLGASTGCSNGTGLPGLDAIEAVAREQRIEITNRTLQPIFTFVVGRNTAAVINWAPCVGGPSCPALAPGRSRSVPYPVAKVVDPEREALVYWWHAVRGVDGVVRPDSIRVKLVVL